MFTSGIPEERSLSNRWCCGCAEALGRFTDGPLPGGVAATRHAHGAGRAWYVGADLDADDLAALLAEPYAAAGLAPRDLPEDV